MSQDRQEEIAIIDDKLSIEEAFCDKLPCTRSQLQSSQAWQQLA